MGVFLLFAPPPKNKNLPGPTVCLPTFFRLASPLYERSFFNVKVGEFGFHAKQNDVSHSALYDIQIPSDLNNEVDVNGPNTIDVNF